MNFIILTIDALSKWYIDNFKKNDGFFEYLEKHTYNFKNMYAMGPFTEAAVRGYWAGIEPLDGHSYLSESYFEHKTFQNVFSKTHYMYYGELVPYYNYNLKSDNLIKRESCEERAFEHVWKDRLNYYCDLYVKGLLNNDELWKIEWILDQFFEKYEKASAVKKEQVKYEEDKAQYMLDILLNQERSEFYKNLWNQLVENCKFPNITCLKNQMKHDLLSIEAIFIKKAKNKNLEIALDSSVNTKSELENVLTGEKCRCIISNNDLLFQMRDQNERLPKLKEEIDNFLSWYDSIGKKLNSPYFAYIHNYDFHYPENFMNARYENFDEYQNEIKILCEKINNVTARNMSVSKQLCLDLIEKNLEYFWNELRLRGIFNNTCVVITADHGISNFMYPVKKSNARWNFTRINFNVPMYIKAPMLKERQDDRLLCANTVPRLLDELEGQEDPISSLLSEVENKEYIFTSWINGIPDFERNKIKLGIRSKEYSITCEGFFTQFFSSLNINGIYNLKEDPDEVLNMPYETLIHDNAFQSLYKKMGDEWYKLVCKIISDKNSGYNFLHKYAYYVQDNLFYNLNKNTSKMTLTDFEHLVSGKKIILWGTGNQGRIFLEKFPDTCELYKVWDENKTRQRKFYGHTIYSPSVQDVCENIIVIICDNNEIEKVHLLFQMGVQNFYLFSRVLTEQ